MESALDQAGEKQFTMTDESQLGQFIPLHYHFLMLQSVPRMQAFHACRHLKKPLRRW